MKRIYFIRHGESEGNAGEFQQGADSSLSKRGRKQAEVVAKRLKKFPIQVILSSTYLRAMETTEIVNKKIKKSIEHSTLLVERRRASVLVGKRNNDPEVITIEKLMQKNFHERTWRHSDEENFEDVKRRALEAIEYIESREESHILVVTHGLFLKLITACMIMGKGLTSHEFHNIYVTFSIDNTGISIFEKTDSSKYKRPWIILTWNDREHLEKLN